MTTAASRRTRHKGGPDTSTDRDPVDRQERQSPGFRYSSGALASHEKSMGDYLPWRKFY
jgi:hypothetical protein